MSGGNFERMSDFAEINEDGTFERQKPKIPSAFSYFLSFFTPKRMVLIKAVLGEGICTFLFMFSVMALGINLQRKVDVIEDEALANATLCVSNGSSFTVTTVPSPKSNANIINGIDFIASGVGTALIAVAIIYSFADVSGAHFNPAVTFATIVTRKTSIRKGLAYISIQCLATVLASAFLLVVFPSRNGVSPVDGVIVTVPSNKNDEYIVVHAFFMEFILTFILIYVIFAVAFDTVDTTNAIQVKDDKDDPTAESLPQKDKSIGRNLTIYTTTGNTKAGFAPIAIGFTLGFLSILGGSVSGGAFNPARVFGPAIISTLPGRWENHWLYWVADLLGAALAAFAQIFFSHKAIVTAQESIPLAERADLD